MGARANGATASLVKKLKRELVERWGTAQPEVIYEIEPYLHRDGWHREELTTPFGGFVWTRAITPTFSAEVDVTPGTGDQGAKALTTRLALRSAFVSGAANAARIWECADDPFWKGPSNESAVLFSAWQEWLAWNAQPSPLMPQLDWRSGDQGAAAQVWGKQHEQVGKPFLARYSDPAYLAEFLAAGAPFTYNVPGNGPNAPNPLMDAALLMAELGRFSEARDLLQRDANPPPASRSRWGGVSARSLPKEIVMAVTFDPDFLRCRTERLLAFVDSLEQRADAV